MRRLALLLAASVSAFAWGPEGHSLVARIAEANLTAEARAQIAALLGPGEALHGLASWADELRRSRPETGPWHFIDIPISRPALDMARDCPAKGCVIRAIEEFSKVLADKNASQTKRREALLFVVHFVGDMHQPLHCSDDGDKGGNQVSVMLYGHQMTLHRMWDSGLLGRMAPEDELYARFSKAVTAETLRQWPQGTLEDWAEEGHQISKQMVYGRLPGVPKTEAAQLGEAYERAAQPVVEQRIEKAGLRLAFMLNAALL